MLFCLIFHFEFDIVNLLKNLFVKYYRICSVFSVYSSSSCIFCSLRFFYVIVFFYCLKYKEYLVKRFEIIPVLNFPEKQC